MNDEATRLQRAKAIFGKAGEFSDSAERSAYLDATCGGDDTLRDEVERLLAAAEEAGDFMATPAVAPFPANEFEEPVAEGPGTVIGPYKLMEQIGEGGFGLVFVAEQLHPVRRQVGLKIIKPGMDTKQVIARFEAERQALALMDHPNIAKVFDAGTTESGRPYFVMELVRGVPITQYCDEHQLNLRERLELFTTLCRAIQHAHQKGIIHRDVKPTNVLVTLHDDRPVPKVIDFGVAKALSQRLTEHTVYTQFAQMIGTPLYMSPEQAELNGLDVDTRSDIYSLGVVLYELLTGTTPFEKGRLKQAAVDEIRRIVREEDPLTPSARLSHSGERLLTTAAQRRTAPAQLTRQVRGELDWIVMKCLEKDRNRRYESANGLAADVEHYLKDEPVQACPPSVLYRFGKFARRNKVAIFTASLVIASLLLGSAIATWQAIRATRAEQIAIANSEQAASEAAKATAISDLLLEMLDSANPDAARGAEFTVRQMLDQFADGLGDQLHDQPEAEATIRLTIGDAYRRLSLLDQAERQIEPALALRQRLFGHDHVLVADALVKKAWLLFERGDYVGSEELAREALAIHRKVTTAPEETLEALNILSLAIWKLDDYDDTRLAPIAQEVFDIAEQNPDGYPQVADLLHRLASSARYRGDSVEAERLARRSVELHRKLQGEHHPETAWGLVELGRALSDQNKLDKAKECFLEALTILRRYYRDSQKTIVRTYVRLADVLRAQGDEKGLNELRSKALEIDAVDDPDWECWQDRAHLHNSLGQWKQEMECFRRGIVLAAPEQAAWLHLELGQALSNQGKLDEAKTCFNDALAIFRKVHRDSETPILAAYWNLGRTAWCQGDEEGHRELTGKIRELPKIDEPDCESWALRGTMLVLMGQWEEATACFRKAIELAPPRRAVELHLDLAVALVGQGREEEADEAMRKPIAAKPDKEAISLNWMAWRLILTGETVGPGVTRAVELAERTVKLAPGDKGYWTTLGIAHYRADQWESAIGALTKAVDLSDGGDAQDWLYLAMAHWQNGNTEGARAWYDRAAQWLDEEGNYRPELRRYRRDAAELLGLAGPQSKTDRPTVEKQDE